MSIRDISCAALICFLLGTHAYGAAASGDRTSIEALIDRAELLNTGGSRQQAREALDLIAERIDEASKEQRVKITLLEARNQALAGEYRKSLDMLTRLSDLDPSPRHELRSLNLCANLSMQISEYVKAFKCLNEAMAMQAKVDDPGLQAGVFGLASYWNSQLGDREKGIRYGQRTLELARQTGSLREECVAHEKLGQAYEQAGRLDEAITTYREGLPKCRNSGDPLFTGLIQILLGRMLHKSGQLEAAERWLQRGIDATRAAGFQDGVLDGLVNYGSLLFDLGRLEEAESLLSNTVETVRSRERWESLSDGYRILAQIAKRRGDIETAYERLERHLEVRENILSTERARLLAFHEVQFDTLAHERQIASLEEQARISRLEAVNRKQRQQLLWISYALAAFLLVVLGLLLAHATRERRHYRKLSTLDSLTALHNHTSFFSEGSRILSDCQSQQQPATLILCDIDYFKQINDRHGHQAGDRVLVKLAARLRDSFVDNSVVGRIGGEEFGIVLGGVNVDAASRQVEALRANIETVRSKDTQIKFTLSFGLAEAREGETFEKLRERADLAMYQAKSAGRDTVVVDA